MILDREVPSERALSSNTLRCAPGTDVQGLTTFACATSMTRVRQYRLYTPIQVEGKLVAEFRGLVLSAVVFPQCQDQGNSRRLRFIDFKNCSSTSDSQKMSTRNGRAPQYPYFPLFFPSIMTYLVHISTAPPPVFPYSPLHKILFDARAKRLQAVFVSQFFLLVIPSYHYLRLR